MNQDNKQRLLDRLMNDVPKEAPIYRQLEEMYIQELESIEPVLDDILHEDHLALLRHVFETVLIPEQVVEVYERLVREGRLRPRQNAQVV